MQTILKHEKIKKTFYISIILIIILFTFSTITFGNVIKVEIKNPYNEIDWDNINYYKANLHTHTTESDGDHLPNIVINHYRNNNYDILAITDHNKNTWPWEKYEININEINMIPISGSEISETHHLGSYFCNYASTESSEDKVLKAIKEEEGLAVFFHPGRYSKSIAWYKYFYEKYDHLVGIEVFNKNDRYRFDRRLWDQLLFSLMPDNPVWGFGNDDMHVIDSDFGWHYNIFLLEENTRNNIKNAMINGHIYIYNPRQQADQVRFWISKVEIKNNKIYLSIEGDYEKIEWISYNTIKQRSEVLSEGNSINIEEIKYKTNFVRAKIISSHGTIYTQPFGIKF